jgi:hypothetical protein
MQEAPAARQPIETMQEGSCMQDQMQASRRTSEKPARPVNLFRRMKFRSGLYVETLAQ